MRISRVPGAEPRGPGRGQRRGFGVRGELGDHTPVAVHPERRAVVVGAAAGHDDGPAAGGAGLDRAAVADPPQAAGTAGPQPDLGRLVRRREQHGVAVDAQHPAYLQARRRHRLEVPGRAGQQAAGAVAVGGPDQAAVRGPGRDAGDDLHPDRVGVLAQHRAPAGARVDGQQPHRALVPALHHHQRVVPVRPAGGDQVGEGVTAGLDVSDGAVEPGQDEGSGGVRGAGRGIGHHRGRALGVGRVGDVPALDRGLVHPLHQQRRAVRGPPVAAGPVHLLGRDELGQPERHPRGAPRVG